MNVEKAKVLVLDDERSVADTMTQILRLYGYSATAAYDPLQAIEWLSSHPCDVLIADVVFEAGQMSGIELAIRLRATLPDCKILLISGNNSTSELLQRAAEQGFWFDILAKPVHPSIVLERLTWMISPSGPIPAGHSPVS